MEDIVVGLLLALSAASALLAAFGARVLANVEKVALALALAAIALLVEFVNVLPK